MEKSEMKTGLFKTRLCRHCGKPLAPRYSNEWVHLKCWTLWKREYHKRYQKKLRRDFRRENNIEP